jgi:copper chaperone CopZ
MPRTTLAIEGMYCDHCLAAVKEALAETPGVQVENVEIGRATIEYDPGQADLGRILDALEDVGYEGREAPESR